MKKKRKCLTLIVIAVMLLVSTVLIPIEAKSFGIQKENLKAAGLMNDTRSSKIETPVIKSLSKTQDEIGIVWNPVKGARGYLVYRKIDSGSWKKLKTVTTTAFYDRDVKVGYTYTYTVKAYKKYNGKNIYSSYDKKGKSGKLTTCITAGFSPKKGTAEISWLETSGASGYYVYRADNKDGKYSRIKTITKGSILSYTNSKLKDGTYYYKVVPYGIVKGKNVIGSSSKAKKIIIDNVSVITMPGIETINCWIYDSDMASHFVRLPRIGIMGAENITNTDSSVAMVSSMPCLLHIHPKRVGSTDITFSYGGKNWKSTINVSKWNSPCQVFNVGGKSYSEEFEKASGYNLLAEKSMTSKIQITPKTGWTLNRIEKVQDGVCTPIKNGSNVNLSIEMTGTAINAYFTNTATGERKKLSFGYSNFKLPTFVYDTETILE